MPEALLWLRAYVGVYVGTLAGRKQLILLLFRRGATTCRVHIPYVVAYVVPEVARQMGHHIGHALNRTVRLADIELRRPRSFLSLAFRAFARVTVA